MGTHHPLAQEDVPDDLDGDGTYLLHHDTGHGSKVVGLYDATTAKGYIDVSDVGDGDDVTFTKA